MRNKTKISFLLLALLGPLCFTACKNAIAPTSASNPNVNNLLPQPPETALSTSIAFTGIATNGDNGFTFMNLQTLTSAVTIYFTDAGWNGPAGQLAGGHIVSFTPSQTLPPGSQVLIAEGQAAASLVVHSQVTGVAGSLTTDGTPGETMGLSKDVMDLIAFTIPSAGSTVFLTALNENTSHPFLTSGQGSKGNSYVPPGLTVGVNAVDLYKLQGENEVFADCGALEFPAQLTTVQVLALLCQSNNWVATSGGGVALPGTNVSECDFSAVILPVPTAVSTPWTGPSPTYTPFPCGYPAATCTPTATVAGTVGPGCINFTGLTYNGNSQFSFVSSVNLPVSQVIYFTNYSYDATAKGGSGGLVDESFTNGSSATTVIEGTLSYTASGTGLSAYSQVVIGNSSDSGGNQLQGGSVINVAGAGGNPYLVQNHNGYGHKVLSYIVPSAGTTTWLGAILFGPVSWVTSGSVTACWQTYLPPGLAVTNTTNLAGLWTSDNLNQYAATSQNDNAILNNCYSDQANILNPGNWVADGNQGKTAVCLYPIGAEEAGYPTAICSSGGGYTGGLP